MQTNEKGVDVQAESRDCGLIVEKRKDCDVCSAEKQIPLRVVGCVSVADTDDTAEGGDANLPASQCAAELEDTIDLALGRMP